MPSLEMGVVVGVASASTTVCISRRGASVLGAVAKAVTMPSSAAPPIPPTTSLRLLVSFPSDRAERAVGWEVGLFMREGRKQKLVRV